MKKNNNWIFPVAFIILIIFWKFSTDEKLEPNPKIEVYNSSIEYIIDVNSEIEVLADSIALPEGPLWDESSNSLLFVDVMGNKMYKWNENDGVSEFISPSGNTGYAPNIDFGLLGANGLVFNNEGDIIVCQHGDRRIASIENTASSSPNFVTVVDNFEGKRFNSPNDLAISKNGDVYFTDPPYGFYYNKKTFDDKFRELDFNGVFKLSKDGLLHLITKEMSLPNGITLSNDEKYIYVNNCGTEDPKIMKFNTSTFKGELFFDGSELSKKYKGCFDGLKVHSSGNIFTTGPNGILIISPNGVLIATINYGKPITNCNFDTNEQYLYVTGFDDISRIKLK